MQMREDADLGDEAALVQRHAPDLVRPRHRYEEGGLLRIDNGAVRAGDRVIAGLLLRVCLRNRGKQGSRLQRRRACFETRPLGAPRHEVSY
jgi:hypothetical protein